MARARSLKPGFFNNEDLIELPFEYRLLFAGLWTIADREGRLEDRPKKIKLHVFPGDNVDVEAGLAALEHRKFIVRYSVSGISYIQVASWSKHQSPHVKEAASTIPAPCEPDANTGLAALIPSSLTPHSLTPDSLSNARAKPEADDETEHREWLDTIAGYPQGAARTDTIGAERAARRLVENGEATWLQLRDGVARYARCVAARGQIVMNPVRFFTAEDRPWSQAWPIPPPKQSFADQAANAMREKFLASNT